MQRLTLHLSGKKVNNISLSTSPYSRVNTLQFELDSIEHANGLTTYINHRFNLDFPIRNDNLFHCENVENFAWLVDILNSLGFLTTQDNIKIGEIINTVAVKIAQKKSLSPFSTPHQVIYLSQIAEFYIDEILKYANTWQDAVALLRLAFMGSCEINRSLIEKFMETRQINDRVFPSLVSLSEIIFGLANIEDELFKYGPLPQLFVIRCIVNDCCLRRLGEKFAQLKDEPQFLVYLSLYILRFSPTQPFTDHESMLRDSLLGKVSQDEYQDTTQMLAGAEQALCLMGIVRVNASPDMARIHALTVLSQSPILQSYYLSLLNKVQLSNAYDRNPLLSAIQQQKPEQVKALINTRGINVCKPFIIHLDQSSIFPPAKQFPLQAAFSSHKINPTRESKLVIKMLARAGAAICVNLNNVTDQTCDLIDDQAIAIDASFPAGYVSKAIQNVDDLAARLDIKHYPTAHTILNNAIEQFGDKRELRLAFAHVELVVSLLRQKQLSNHYGIVLESIQRGKYTEALRLTCHLECHEDAVILAKLILKYQQVFNLNINEGSSYSGKTAYDYACERQNEVLIDTLNYAMNRSVEIAAARKKEKLNNRMK